VCRARIVYVQFELDYISHEATPITRDRLVLLHQLSMMRLRRSAVTCLTAALLWFLCDGGIPAHAGETDTCSMVWRANRVVRLTADTHADIEATELVSTLAEWIGAHTNYDVAPTLDDPPRLSFCRVGEIIKYDSSDLVVDASLRAAYDLSSRTIYLVLPWHPENIPDQSRLLHELVHDVQFANRQWACNQEPEREAYKLQDKWLAERGVKSNFNWLQILLLSECPRRVHP
jgi:hypothetical protein